MKRKGKPDAILVRDVVYHLVPDKVREAIRYLMECDGDEHVGDGPPSEAISELGQWLKEIEG